MDRSAAFQLQEVASGPAIYIFSEDTVTVLIDLQVTAVMDCRNRNRQRIGQDCPRSVLRAVTDDYVDFCARSNFSRGGILTDDQNLIHFCTGVIGDFAQFQAAQLQHAPCHIHLEIFYGNNRNRLRTLAENHIDRIPIFQLRILGRFKGDHVALGDLVAVRPLLLHNGQIVLCL